MVKQVRFVRSLFTDDECFKQKSGAKTKIYRGGGQVLVGDVVIKALSYRNALSLLIFQGRGVSGHTPPIDPFLTTVTNFISSNFCM